MPYWRGRPKSSTGFILLISDTPAGKSPLVLSALFYNKTFSYNKVLVHVGVKVSNGKGREGGGVLSSTIQGGLLGEP